MREILDLAWDRFKIIGGIVGDIQSRLIATAFYYTILVPFGLGTRLFSDPLNLTPIISPAWLRRDPVENELTAAKRQG
ncbi:MAG: hypothetical protein H6672_10380 [Anaerolineaceae bacterium]|nr:hypothetical protein [Anaerolineaceae bacterium]